MSRPSWPELAPGTERTWPGLSPDVLAAIGDADAEELAKQRGNVAPHVAEKLTEPTYSLRNRFRYWEVLVRTMERDWAPQGTYVIEEYLNDLDSRDRVDELLAALPDTVAHALHPLLDELDRRFVESTEPDGGDELRSWSNRLRQGVPMSDRWYRRPRTVPWR